MPDAKHLSSEQSDNRLWHVKSGAIDELVPADDQWEAWDQFRGYPVEAFGLLLSAEPNENADPLLVRTSHAMVRWDRMEDAKLFAARAAEFGLPDTLAQDIANVEKARH